MVPQCIDVQYLFFTKWCGRGDLNSHGLGPTDFKSVMSTIPSRPRGWYVSGDSPANPMMQKESLLYWQKKYCF